MYKSQTSISFRGTRILINGRLTYVGLPEEDPEGREYVSDMGTRY